MPILECSKKTIDSSFSFCCFHRFAMAEEKPFTAQSAVVRIYHTVDLVEGCAPMQLEEGQVDLTMFKTIKITGTMITSEIIGVLSQKLKINDKATFSIYSLDSTSNSSSFHPLSVPRIY